MYVTLDEGIKELVNDSVDAWHVCHRNEAVSTVCIFDYKQMTRSLQHPGCCEDVLAFASTTAANTALRGAAFDKWVATKVLHLDQQRFGAEGIVTFGARFSRLRFRFGPRGRSGKRARYGLLGVASLSLWPPPCLGRRCRA